MMVPAQETSPGAPEQAVLWRELGFKGAALEKFLRGYLPRPTPTVFSGIDPRKAGPADVRRVAFESHTTFYSPYWSVYEFSSWDPAFRNSRGRQVGRLDYQTAILDKIFLEEECQPCGELCPHTMEEVRHLVTWAQDQGIRPKLVASGGKSIHVYLPCPAADVPGPKKQRTIRHATEAIVEAASLALADPQVVGTGIPTMARIPEGYNAIDKKKCAVLDPDEFLTMTIGDVISATETPPTEDAYASFFSVDGGESLTTFLERVAAAVRPPPERRATPTQHGYSACPTVENVLTSRATPGTRYYHALCVVDHCRAEGKTEGEAAKVLEQWDNKNKIGLGHVRRQDVVSYQYGKRDPPTRPCAWLVNVGHRCPHCLRPVRGK